MKAKYIYHYHFSFQIRPGESQHHDGIVELDHKVNNTETYEATQIVLVKRQGIPDNFFPYIIMDAFTFLHKVSVLDQIIDKIKRFI